MIALCLLAVLLHVAHAQVAVLFVEEFSSYTGGAAAPNGANGALDTEIFRVKTNSVDVSYGDTAPGSDDYSRGVKVPFAERNNGQKIFGGIGAVELEEGKTGLYMQPTGSYFNPGFVELRIAYEEMATEPTPILVRAEFEFWTFNDGERSSEWQLGFATGSAAPETVTPISDGRFSTPRNGSANVEWQKGIYDIGFAVVVQPGDTHLYLRFTGQDVENMSGSRDAVALANLEILGAPCSASELGSSLCECKADGTCNSMLSCNTDSICVRPCEAEPGSVGCSCVGEQKTCATSDLACATGNNVCTPGGCARGSPSCICNEDGTCNETGCSNGVCGAISCPDSAAENEAECMTRCMAEGKVWDGVTCRCQAGLYTNSCVDATTTAATTTATATSVSGTATSGTGATPSSTMTGATSTQESTATTATEAPAVSCPVFCGECVNNSDCYWCGNDQDGTCQPNAGTSSCNFPPFTDASKCETQTAPPTPRPTPGPTTSEAMQTPSPSTAMPDSATANTLGGLVALVALLAAH